MKRDSTRFRAGACCLVLASIAFADVAEAAFSGFAAPVVAVRLGDQTTRARALRLCVVAGSRLPIQHEHRVEDEFDPGGRLDIQRSPGSVPPPGLLYRRGGLASATIIEQTPTRLVVRGFVFDLWQVLRTGAVFATGPGTVVYTTTYCNAFDACTQIRMDIEHVGPTSSVDTTFCDAPPVLRAADDDGLRSDDDCTSAQPLRFDVASSESTVTLPRDGIPIDTREVIGGTATLEDGTPPVAREYACQVDHGRRAPSAVRFVERRPVAIALFDRGFEGAQ